MAGSFTLNYTLDSACASNFAAINFTKRSSYSVTVAVTDRSGESATGEVVISVLSTGIPSACLNSCNSADSRSVPASYGLQIWPAAHPLNPQAIDLVIAPADICAQLTLGGVCTATLADQIEGADGIMRYVVGTAAAFHMEVDETLSCAGAAGSLACAPATSRTVPPSFGLQIWPALHPQNPQAVDLVVAPAAACALLSPSGVCTTLAANQIVGSDGVKRFVVGTAATFHMETATRKLSCPSGGAFAAGCSDADSNAVPSGVQIWPATHPQNPQAVDLVIAPSAVCVQLASVAECAAAASIVGADGVMRFVVGTAAEMNMEAAETLSCAGT